MTKVPGELQSALTNHYTLERELGRGGMATVYLARDLRHDRPVALKVLLPELARALGPERFLREVRTTARLQHPHILPVLDSGEAVGQLWYTMPYVRGESLRDRLVREAQLPVDVAVDLARQVALALDYAHREGVVHRDLKPENILLSEGQALVADFGLAKAIAPDGESELTETGMSVGTPAYMSPEQASAGQVDARSDIYALGCVLYEMLAGEPPFSGPTAQAVIAKRLSGDVPNVRRVRSTVPESLEHAVRTALAPVAADRFATATEFARALQQPATTSSTLPLTPAVRPVGSGSMAPAGKARRRGPMAATVLGVSFLIGLGALFARERSQPSGVEESGGAKRLAVLPFENLGAPEDEYFADGVTDAVRGKLATIPSLQVIARSSSSQYKRTAKTPQVIGRELGVQYLLTGTVRWEKGKSGQNRVQVSPELVQVATGSTKWQAPFDAAITDVFRVQADVAGEVADALNLALGATQRQTLTEKPTTSLPAYDAFLKGEAAAAYLTRLDGTSLVRAIDFYHRAVTLDPQFVQAWAQLARAHARYYLFVIPTPAADSAAKQAADRAHALAPGGAAAALARGTYLALIHDDAAQALSTFQAGLRAESRNVELLVAAATQERAVGQVDSAVALLRTAQLLDPRSLVVAQEQGFTLYLLRRYPESLAAYERALTLAPQEMGTIAGIATVHVGQGDLAAARAVVSAAATKMDPIDVVSYFASYGDVLWVLDRAQEDLVLRLRPSQGAFANDRGTWALALAQIYYGRGNRTMARVYGDTARQAYEEQLRGAPQDAQRHALLGVSLAYAGRHDEAIRAGERATRLRPLGGDWLNAAINQYWLAKIHLILGERDKAIDQLESLVEMPYWVSRGWLKIDPQFAPLRGHPRFERLVAGK